MDVGTISIVLVLGLIVLLAIGMPLGLASASLALVVLVMRFEPALLTDPWCHVRNFAACEAERIPGMLTSRPGTEAFHSLTQNIFDLMTEHVLLSVPLFIFMAALLERTGIVRATYDALGFWLSGLRGGIAVATLLMAVIMAAMSGIIGGTVVLLGLIALPQMLRLGYDRKLAVGTVCASGSLGTMIPPSIVLIMYGLITQTPVRTLFTGAVVPGLMLASFIIAYIVLRVNLNPSLAPLPEPGEGAARGQQKAGLFGAFLALLLGGVSALLLLRAVLLTIAGRNVPGKGETATTWGMPGDIPYILGVLAICVLLALFVFGRHRCREGWKHGKGLVPPFAVIGVVLGSIYGGVTGIAEAAGMGALAVLVIAVARGEASVALIWDALIRTLRSTGAIVWVTIGAAALAGAYTLAGGPVFVANMIVGWGMPTMLVLPTMMLVLLIIGAFMDWVGIVLLIVPVFLVVVKRLPIDEIGLIGQLDAKHVAVWFGVLFCMNMQVSLLSPPFGPAAFHLKSVAPPYVSLTDIFRGVLPFICIQLLALSVMLVWPGIVTILL